MVLDFEPKSVMKYFEEICSVPHGSGNTKMISDYLMEFAVKNDLEAVQDDINNVIIYKNATEDKKDSDPVIIQGHMDMVAVKDEWCQKNMEKEGLDLQVEEGFVSAKGTSLGGDDGIAVAYALALLESKDISHPKLTCIFTVDEETGMDGATNIDLSDVDGKILMNIDSEEEGIFLAGCAGGAGAKCILPMTRKIVDGKAYEIVFSGFTGGHSGVEIHKNRANANNLSGRLLMELMDICPVSVKKLEGGEKDNAIAKILRMTVVVDAAYEDALQNHIKEFEQTIRNEYRVSDPGLSIAAEYMGEGEFDVIEDASLVKLVMAINYIPSGVQKMSMDIPGLVQTSLNLGILNLKETELSISYSVRSSLQSEKDNLLKKIENFAMFLGGECVIEGQYPAWEYRPESRIRDLMVDSYRRLYGEEPKVETIHAGLECGIMASKIDNLDCVSFGPRIDDIHTTKEKMEIASVERTWKLLLDVLKNI